MPVNSANQGIPEQQGADPANLPSAQVSWDGIMENRLVQRYASSADRTARRPAPNENEISALADVDRIEIFDNANWVSLRQRANFASVRQAANQALTVSSTALQDVTNFFAALPTAGTFQWETVIYCDGPVAGDIQFAYAVPAGIAMIWGGHGLAPAATASTGDGSFGTATTSNGPVSFGTVAAGTITVVTHWGEITMGGTAGNLQLRAAQNTSDPGTTTIRARTRMHVWRIF
jgi:hypothetical protein